MRKDLNMKPGKMCAQAAHASMKATLLHMEDPRVKEWLAGKFTKIAVGVNSEEELLDVLERARAAGIIAELCTDAGLTVFDGVPTNTCIAVGPDTHENLQPITGGLKLL
jgi:PTH2 family peptidyl-tRNA hydrolase